MDYTFMLQNLKTPAIVVVVIAVIVGYFYSQVDWESRAIRKQFQALTEVVEKDGPVSTFEALSRSRRLSGFFTEPVSVEYFRGRFLPRDLDAMGAGFLAAWGQVDAASVNVVRHELELQAGGQEARSLVTLRCRVVVGGRDQMRDTLKYQITWQKVEGTWRIQRIFPVD
ncbi:MAG: hypothetical protein EA353_02725 [Puniceicoccaceae bacterium]|nr:MAG: hypothetical protein EA353_02725 [Puniceicoccaceae bacterium]